MDRFITLNERIPTTVLQTDEPIYVLGGCRHVGLFWRHIADNVVFLIIELPRLEPDYD